MAKALPKKLKTLKAVARAAKKVSSRKRANPTSLLANLNVTELAITAGVGMGAYTVTRLAGRLGYSVAKGKSLSLAKHLGPWSSVVAAILATYLSSGKVKKLSKYRDAIIVGAWVAALQGVLQTYFARWGWILNDYHMQDLPALKSTAIPPSLNPRDPAQYLEGDEELHVPARSSGASEEDDFSDIPGLNDGSLQTGIFSGGF